MKGPTLILVVTSVLLRPIYGLQTSTFQDNNFTIYLNDSIKGYGTWLQAQWYDPSPPIQEVLHITSFSGKAVELDCELRNQQVRGHSVASVENVEVGVSFTTTSHYFEVGRTLNQSIHLESEFECRGKLNSVHFPELNTDVYISGTGRFALNTSSSSEFISFINVGITENYTLDFKHSYTDYGLSVKTLEKEITGNWNVSNYLSNITNEFFVLYERSLDTGTIAEKQQANPQYRLLKEYMDFKTKDLNLKTFYGENDLPNPYDPTPIPPTTMEPTTQITEKVSSLSTGGSTESTTGANKAMKNFLSLGALCTICMHLYSII